MEQNELDGEKYKINEALEKIGMKNYQHAKTKNQYAIIEINNKF